MILYSWQKGGANALLHGVLVEVTVVGLPSCNAGQQCSVSRPPTTDSRAHLGLGLHLGGGRSDSDCKEDHQHCPGASLACSYANGSLTNSLGSLRVAALGCGHPRGRRLVLGDRLCNLYLDRLGDTRGTGARRLVVTLAISAPCALDDRLGKRETTSDTLGVAQAGVRVLFDLIGDLLNVLVLGLDVALELESLGALLEEVALRLALRRARGHCRSLRNSLCGLRGVDDLCDGGCGDLPCQLHSATQDYGGDGSRW